MKRRDFVTSVLVAGLATPVMGDSKGGKEKGPETQEGHDGHGRHDDDERHRNVTVSFGHWLPTPDYPADPAELNTAAPQPIDRFAPNDVYPRRLNGHVLIPNPVHIRVGDTVSFVISGFHNLVIYGPGTQPADILIDPAHLIISTPPPPFPPLINDPTNRLYRGLDPRTQPLQDRVEVVGFNTAGRYLVICGVLPHFTDGLGNFFMFGYINVRNDDN